LTGQSWQVRVDPWADANVSTALLFHRATRRIFFPFFLIGWHGGRHVQRRHVQGRHVQGRRVQGRRVQGRRVQGRHVQGRHVQGRHVQGRHVHLDVSRCSAGFNFAGFFGPFVEFPEGNVCIQWWRNTNGASERPPVLCRKEIALFAYLFVKSRRRWFTLSLRVSFFFFTAPICRSATRNK